MLKPKDFAEKIGVTVKTLQNWDNDGILKAQRTPTNRRYYTEKTNTYVTLSIQSGRAIVRLLLEQ